MKHLRKILPAALLAVVAVIVICVISISSKNTVSKEAEASLTAVATEQSAAKSDNNDSNLSTAPVAKKDTTSASDDKKTSSDQNSKTKETKSSEKAETQSSTSIKAVGIVNDDGVNFRKKASTDSKILTTLSDGTTVSILAKKGDWYKVEYDGKTGYMSSDYVTKKTSASGLKGYAEITADVLNMRADPNASGDVVAMIAQGEYVKLRGFKDGWYKVSYGDYSGYMSADYLSLVAQKPQPVQAPEAVVNSSNNSSSNSNSNNSSSSSSSSTEQSKKPSSLSSGQSAGNGSGTGSDIVDYALSFSGVPYVYGGASPSGFDCSGFTMYVYNHFGYSLPHGATPQMNYGSYVGMSALTPGDLVFFFDPAYASSGASHVGIYIGGGQFVHASSYGRYCILVSSFYGDSSTGDYYASTFIGGRHIA